MILVTVTLRNKPYLQSKLCLFKIMEQGIFVGEGTAVQNMATVFRGVLRWADGSGKVV